MPRPKSLILNMEITAAGRSHNCRHNDNHRIAMGQRRLTITVDREKQHYCLDCAKAFLSKDMERLKTLFDEVSSP